VTSFLLFLLLLPGVGLLLLSALWVRPDERTSWVQALMAAGAAIGGFVVVLEVMLGCVWLNRHLLRQPFHFAPDWTTPPPGPPLRWLLLPPLTVVAGYAALHLVIWFAAAAPGELAPNWMWGVIWGGVAAIAAGCRIHFGRTLPRTTGPADRQA
jgi:hypothetical protein